MIVGFHRVASDCFYTDSWKWGNSASEDRSLVGIPSSVEAVVGEAASYFVDAAVGRILADN
jgi:hypothetical protein